MFAVFILIIFLVGVMAFVIVSKFTAEFDAANVPGGEIAVEQLEGYEAKMPVFFDWMMLTIVLLVWFGLVAGVYYLDNLPVFVILFLFLGILTFIVTLPLVNMIYGLSIDAEFQQYFDAFPRTMFVITNWAVVMAFFLVSIVGAYIAKPRESAGGGFV
jgi:hypothetical protein